MVKKSVWILGSRGYIGSALARELDTEYNVVCLSRQVLDLSGNQTFMDAAVRSLVGHYGEPDAVVHCASHVVLTGLLDTTQEQYAESFRVNVLGPFSVNKTLIQSVSEDRKIRFVHMASLSARVSMRSALPYCVSKAAVVAQVKLLAYESAERYGNRYTFLCVSPSSVSGSRGQPDAGEWRSVFPLGYTPVMPQVPMTDVLSTLKFALTAPDSMSGSNLEISGVTAV